MREWLILCGASEFLLEKKRFKEIPNATVKVLRERELNAFCNHLEEKKPVLCIGMPPEEILKTKNPEYLHILVQFSPFCMPESIKKIQDKTHLLYMDRVFCDDAIKYFHKNAEYIAPDCKSYIAGTSKRAYPVLFVNGYLDIEDGKTILEKRTSKLVYPLLTEVISKNRKDYSYSVEQSWKEVLEKEKLDYDSALLEDLTQTFYETIMLYEERIDRSKTIDALLKKDIPVALVGEYWDVYMEKLDDATKKLLTVVSNYRTKHEIMEAMKRSQVVVNVNRFTQNGISADVQMALNLGCIVVTERNSTTQELSDAGWPMLTYEAGKYADCVKKVQTALKKKRTDWISGNEKKCPLINWLFEWEKEMSKMEA